MAKKKPDVDDEVQDEGDGTVAVNDAWTGLLAISLIALLAATGFLVWDWMLMPENPTQPFRFTSKPPGALAPAKAVPKVEEAKEKEKEKDKDDKEKDKDKDKEKDKDKDDKDKDKDNDKDKDKEKDKGQAPCAPRESDAPAFVSVERRELCVEPRRLMVMRREDMNACP